MRGLAFPRNPVLVVDDEPGVLEALSDVLSASGITNVLTCGDSREVMGILDGAEIETVLLDLAMPHLPGREVLADIRDAHPEVPVIVVTASHDVATAVECMKAGAFDYMVKVVEESRLVSGVRRAIEIRGLRREVSDLSRQFQGNRLRHPQAFAPILTADRTMHALFVVAESVARTVEPVLISGETGVGKNLLARAVHEVSAREGSLVEVNVAGLDDAMFSDALFGHRRGAFTGATEARDGLVHQAAGGTLFLDEIGDLSIPSQIKLLRLLDTREYYPLGSDLPRRSDARVVVATNRDLRALMAGSSFRRDLFFRLSTHELAVPPLRERRGDLALLLDHFLDEAARALGRDKATVSPALLALLDAYHFPGNVRELRSLVFDAASRQAGQELPLGPFKAAMGALQPTGETGAAEMVFPSRLPTLKQATELLVVEALRRSKGNQSIAAAMLGVSHQALSKRVRRGSAAQGLGAGREGRGATRGITALPAAPGPSDDSPPPRTKPVPPRG